MATVPGQLTVQSIPRGCPQPQAPKGRASSWNGDPSRPAGSLVGPIAPQNPCLAVPAVSMYPSCPIPPHLPPGRRSPASLPGGAPRGIPTFRNRPGDDLSGLIKYAKRFPPPLSSAGRCGSEAPPRPRLTQRGRLQGNLPSASPLLPPASGPTACLSFPVCEVGAAPRSPGERRRSCRRRRPGNPWTRNKGTLEPPAAGSPQRPPSCWRGESRVLPPPIPGDPPKPASLLGEAKRPPECSASSGQGAPGVPRGILLLGDPAATGGAPAAWMPGAVPRGGLPGEVPGP